MTTTTSSNSNSSSSSGSRQEEEGMERRPKRSSTEESKYNSEEEPPNTRFGRTTIPKKPRTSIESNSTQEEDSIVVQARKALEMFHEIEAEDGDVTKGEEKSADHHHHEKHGQQENEKPLKSIPRPQKAHRIPIISQRDELLL
eukprot:scaffold925_cov129-Cylindrotheca_fusiformis.AAC.34